MLQILYADCLGLSLTISAHFTLLKCVLQPKITKNSRKPLILRVQGRSKSSMLIKPNKKPVTSGCYDKQHVYTYLQPFFTLDEPISEEYRLLGGTHF